MVTVTNMMLAIMTVISIITSWETCAEWDQMLSCFGLQQQQKHRRPPRAKYTRLHVYESTWLSVTAWILAAAAAGQGTVWHLWM